MTIGIVQVYLCEVKKDFCAAILEHTFVIDLRLKRMIIFEG